jgi:hypothetical protein
LVELALQSVYFRPQRRTSRAPAISVEAGRAPAGAKCNPRARSGQRGQARVDSIADLLNPVSIFCDVALVRTFFSFSTWSDKHTFINDYKLLKADVAKFFSQIEQSYV